MSLGYDLSSVSFPTPCTTPFPLGNQVFKTINMFYQSFLTISYGFILEKEMATHSNILAWEIPWTEEPGGLQSMGS